jgi:hypothetical protein
MDDHALSAYRLASAGRKPAAVRQVDPEDHVMLKSVLAALAVAALVTAMPLAAQAQSTQSQSTSKSTSDKKTTAKTTEKKLTPQQQKMKDCSAKWQDEKKAKKVSGKTAHNKFMSTCLKS